MVGLRRAAILIAVALFAGQAHAQSDDAMQRARSHFEAGRALYNLGNYTDAVREFAAGYQLAPRPKFLVNLGQCYRKLGDLDKARDMYARYVHDAAPDDAERGPAQQELRDIESQIAARQQSATPPPAAGPETTRSAETPPPMSTPAQETLTASAPPPRKSWIKRNWWVIPVGAVVVGTAVGLGVYFGTRSSSPCQPGDLLCVDGSKWAVQQ